MIDEIIKTNKDPGIITTRTFNWSEALVYKAWTDPNHYKTGAVKTDLQILLMTSILK